MIGFATRRHLMVVVAGLAMASGALSTQAQTVGREGGVEQMRYRRVGLLPPSCDDRSRLMLGPGHDDATVRHNQLVHSMRHNFKGYQIKPKCAFQQVGPARAAAGRK